jgi:oligopeptide/dipeptide ABC transporter ATP-binding protein
MSGNNYSSGGSDEPLLAIEDVSIQYETNRGDVITAVSNASLTITEGEYFGLVGESGSGKSTLAKSVIGGLDDNGRVTSGEIRYKGDPIQDLSHGELNDKIRWNEISWIPQASMNSLDPLKKIGEQAVTLAKTHTDLTRSEAIEKFGDTFEVMGLQRERMFDYPHQFSGGMKQRAMIAMAIFLEPSLLIADEPTTALDVIMQDQIFDYIGKLQDEFNTSMLLITHDISVVFESCDTIGVMHGGQISEVAPATRLFDAPHHPYTIKLQQAFPDIRYPDRNLQEILGHPPQPHGEVDYCTFANRCPWAKPECENGEPPLEPAVGELDDGLHQVACIRQEVVQDEQEAKLDREA